MTQQVRVAMSVLCGYSDTTVTGATVYAVATEYREVNKNNLLGGHFLIFLPKNPGK